MANILLPSNPSGLYISSSSSRSQVNFISLPYRCIATALIKRRRLPVFRASKDDKEVMNSTAVEPAPSVAPLFSLNVPTWANWLWGALVLLTFPFYRRIRRIQDEVEKTVETVADVVESAAEVTEKISSAVAEALPEGKIKKVILEVGHVAEVVDRNAEAVETLIHKIDEVEAEVDSLVDPPLGKREEYSKGDAKK
ncbi:hypothetical protein J5N97_009627 [Dioscorea zingiberensis]|uniref:Uncharacterized protein n=1 Tax=Dioscorea zingiberensis TaxID=325984 RepID=A0A9D5CZ47_9LILI|nr:hypothetical protein J5N97_009627 [Dioscorea zingiberensis]